MSYFQITYYLRKYLSLLFLLPVLFALAGCASPVGVIKLSPQDSYRHSAENVLSSGKVSDSSKAVLQRYNLLESFNGDTKGTIQALLDIGETDKRRDILYTLSELSYLQGEKMLSGYSPEARKNSQDVFLQSAVFAYFFLLDNERELTPTAYDKRFHLACDLYNRSLWLSFSTNADNSLNLSGGVRHLSGRDLELAIKTDSLFWSINEFKGFYPSDSYAVVGFTIRNRTPGLGLPLVGLTKRSNESPTNGGALPITAFLRLNGNFTDYLAGFSRAYLELYSVLDNSEVQVNDHTVPLVTDITTPLAYKLKDSRLWTMGGKRFLTGAKVDQSLLFIQPYQPGRIPVVFVHGTASSPVWWAEMLNSLRADPIIRKRFQFWFYEYISSNMVMLSAAELRESLTAMVGRLDPNQTDQTMNSMVIIGHSQGGLLTKMAVVNPGDALWHSLSNESIDEMKVNDTTKKFVRRLLFFEPLPFVTRVVFISTPHRGSYLSKGWVRSIVRKVIRLPFEMVMNSEEFFSSLGYWLKLPDSMKGVIPTSIDGMSAENPLLEELAGIPFAPGVTGHSIVSVKPGMDIATGNDGVVEYKSAHIDDVESELIVRAEHSCQDFPATIEEVRRILLKHLSL